MGYYKKATGLFELKSRAKLNLTSEWIVESYMPTKHRRYSLKTKEAKQVLLEASRNVKFDLAQLYGEGANVEIVETECGAVYLIEGKPVLYKAGDRVLPTLHFSEFIARAPKIVVDMGAVPYVCKGADVMAPGIVRVEGVFGKGDLVLIVDVKHGKALAIGESLMDSETEKQVKKGPVVKSLHFVSDKIWDSSKPLASQI